MLLSSLSEECSLRKARQLLQRARFLPSMVDCYSEERVAMGDVYRHHRVMRAGWKMGQCSCSACFFCLRKTSDFSDTGVSGVTMSAEPALVKLPLQVEPRCPRRLAQSKQKQCLNRRAHNSGKKVGPYLEHTGTDVDRNRRVHLANMRAMHTYEEVGPLSNIRPMNPYGENPRSTATSRGFTFRLGLASQHDVAPGQARVCSPVAASIMLLSLSPPGQIFVERTKEERGGRFFTTVETHSLCSGPRAVFLP